MRGLLREAQQVAPLHFHGHAIQALAVLRGHAALRAELVTGADELARVRSGLDDTMRQAYDEISETFHQNDEIDDYRTAAFVVA